VVDSSTLTLGIGLIVISVLLVTFLLYTRQVLRRRSQQLRLELDERPSAKDDRAFNQIRLSAAEADVLERSGVEVAHARELLQEAQRSYDRRDFDSAERRARSAHESLVALRGKAPRRLPSLRSPSGASPAVGASPSSPVGPRFEEASAPTPTSGPGLRGVATSAVPTESSPTGSGRLPKNRAEAHFQMTLLVEEIARARTTPGSEGLARDADQIRAEAQAAYGRADFTEALRLALRGRRRVGGRLETLPPSRSTQPESAGPAGGAPAGPSGEEAAAATTAHCPRCGKGIRASDKFCRGCGASLKASQCPRCGQPLQPDDVFCAGCGAPAAP
jgi:hypothetical protein